MIPGFPWLMILQHEQLIISNELTYNAANKFIDPIIASDDGGHHPPSTGGAFDSIITFVNGFINIGSYQSSPPPPFQYITSSPSPPSSSLPPIGPTENSTHVIFQFENVTYSNKSFKTVFGICGHFIIAAVLTVLIHYLIQSKVCCMSMLSIDLRHPNIQKNKKRSTAISFVLDIKLYFLP